MNSYEMTKKLGWLSSFARQVLLSRLLLRVAPFTKGQLTLGDEADARLLAVFRVAVTIEAEATSGTNAVFAPYQPSNRPHTYFLRHKANPYFHFRLATSRSELPIIEIHWELDNLPEHRRGYVEPISSGERVDRAAFQVFAEELRSVGRGVGLSNKSVADDRCSRLQFEPLWAGAFSSYGEGMLGEFEKSFGYLEFDFWRSWYRRKLDGSRLPSEITNSISGIPDALWTRGTGEIAAEIARIETDYWSANLPQAEQLVRADGGRYDVQPDATPPDRTLENMLNQIAFAVELPLQTNCGFNEMCVGYKYLFHALNNCRDDPNTVEQHFQQARNIIRKRILEGVYQADDSLQALVDGLEQHALQIRGAFPEVREAHAIRVQQKIRETDDKTLIMVAGGMRAFQEAETTGRLFDETGLDAEAVERDSGIEAKAAAIQRTGGRAARVEILKRTSQAVKDVEGSALGKGAQTAAAGYSIVQMLKDIFGGA